MNPQRDLIRSFLTFVSTQPGADWHCRHVYLDGEGWKVEWRVNDKSFAFAPAPARKLARDMQLKLRQSMIGKTSAERATAKCDETLAWLEAFDLKAKEAIHFNRQGVVPQLQAA